MEQYVEKYGKAIRILHWVHSGAFVILLLIGLVLFIPQLGVLAQDSWTRVIHRIAAVVFVAGPVLFMLLKPKSTLGGIKDALTWGKEDIGWVKAAPKYYFLCDEKGMPPQDHFNTGQKMWWFLVLVTSSVFVATGFIMWFLKAAAPAALLQWCVVIHDLAFIAAGVMLFVHIYLAVIHPLMRPLRVGGWNAMVHGTVSVEYAKEHHGKWYDRVSKGTQESPSAEK